MGSPFPGVDPFLEGQGVWHDFHVSFNLCLRKHLMPLLPKTYVARIEEHVYLLTMEPTVVPNKFFDPTRVRFIEIRTRNDDQVVTVIETLPLQFQARDYFAMISRGDHRPDCEMYGWNLPAPLPVIPIPLKSPDPDVKVNLQEVFAAAFELGPYDELVRYDQPVGITLPEKTRDWVSECVRGHGA